MDSPWPKTTEDGYALRDRFGWKPDYREPALFTSDVRPHESSSYFTARDGKIKSLKIPVTDIAPEEARGDSLKDALVSCIVESPEEMFIASEYQRLVAKGYISEDE